MPGEGWWRTALGINVGASMTTIDRASAEEAAAEQIQTAEDRMRALQREAERMQAMMSPMQPMRFEPRSYQQIPRYSLWEEIPVAQPEPPAPPGLSWSEYMELLEQQRSQAQQENPMAMSAKDYENVAGVIKMLKPDVKGGTIGERRLWARMVGEMAKMCKHTYANFDRERFYAACEYTEGAL